MIGLLRKIIPANFKRGLIYCLSPLFAKIRIKRWKGLPQLVIIENTNKCNARCIICPNDKMRREKGIMTFDLYKHVIHECVLSHIDRIVLAGTGEPFIDPQIIEKIKYAKENGIKEVGVFTNVSLLNNRIQDHLLSCGVDTVCLSIDGFTQETYERVRRDLAFDRVKNNTLGLLNKRRQLGLKKPYVVVVAFDLSETQGRLNSNEFYRELNQLSDRVIVTKPYGLHSWSGGVEGIAAVPYTNVKQPCRRLWDSFSVLWNGDCSLCCVDYEGSFLLGNINEQSIPDMFNSKKIDEVRRHHMRCAFDKVQLCEKCYERPPWVQKNFERTLDLFE
ncbi:MAG: SPASM domain-containing protein [Deltaproteobacteria bacterium]|nr:SPASM domain-containing protein [Deltaproteobacteria bacterium]